MWDNLLFLEDTQWWVHGVHCNLQTKQKKGRDTYTISQNEDEMEWLKILNPKMADKETIEQVDKTKNTWKDGIFKCKDITKICMIKTLVKMQIFSYWKRSERATASLQEPISCIQSQIG
jgi:hypothetical protein